MTNPTTITNNNPPTTPSCCLNQPSNCRVKSETPHPRPLTQADRHLASRDCDGNDRRSGSDKRAGLERLASQQRASDQTHLRVGADHRVQIAPRHRTKYTIRSDVHGAKVIGRDLLTRRDVPAELQDR